VEPSAGVRLLLRPCWQRPSTDWPNRPASVEWYASTSSTPSSRPGVRVRRSRTSNPDEHPDAVGSSQWLETPHGIGSDDSGLRRGHCVVHNRQISAWPGPTDDRRRRDRGASLEPSVWNRRLPGRGRRSARQRLSAGIGSQARKHGSAATAQSGAFPHGSAQIRTRRMASRHHPNSDHRWQRCRRIVRSHHDPTSHRTFTVISNTSAGAWPMAHELIRQFPD